MSLLNVLITLLVFALVFGVAWWVLSLIPLPHPFKVVAEVALGLIALLLLLGLLFGGIDVPLLRVR